MKNESSNKEKSQLIANNAQKVMMKSVEKFLPTFDKDLAFFTVCSALSLKSDRFYNNFSMCCLIQDNRKNEKIGKKLSDAESINENCLYIDILTGLLGSKIIDN